MARIILILLGLPVCQALFNNNLERPPFEQSSGLDQEESLEHNTFGQIDLPLEDTNLPQTGWMHEHPDPLMYSDNRHLPHHQDSTWSSIPHTGHQYSGYQEYPGTIHQQPSSSWHPPSHQQPGYQSFYDTGTCCQDQGRYMNYDYDDSQYLQYGFYPFHGSSSNDPYQYPPVNQEQSLLLASASTSSHAMLNPVSDQGQSEIMSRYYTTLNRRGISTSEPQEGREERGREQIQNLRAASIVNIPIHAARIVAEAAQEPVEPLPRAPSMTTRQIEESRDLVRAILGVEWTRRGLSHTTHPQELAAQVAEIKLTHPGHDRSIGQLAKLYVQSWNDYDYLYDYKAWVESYTIKINSLRIFYRELDTQHEWSIEQLNWAVLNNFRAIQISHHGTLADPTQEAEEMSIAQRVCTDFLHRQIGQEESSFSPQQASDMPSMAHYCSGYRYGSSSYTETMKYIKKYLRQILGVSVAKIEELTELLPESVIAAARPTRRRRRRRH